MLYNLAGNQNMFYTLLEPTGSSTVTSVPSQVSINPGDANYWNTMTATTITPGPTGLVYVTVNFTSPGTAPTTKDVRLTYQITNNTSGRYPPTYQGAITIPAGSTTYSTTVSITAGSTWINGDSLTAVIKTEAEINATGTSTTVINYITSITDTYRADTNGNGNYWYAIDQNTIKLSLTQSFNYGNFIFSASINESTGGMDLPVFSLSGSQMDLIRLYNQTGQWTNKSEYRIKSVYSLTDVTGSFIVVDLDRNLDPGDTDSGTIPGKISKYMLLKRLPDETNVILNYDLTTAITQDGLLFPQYIEDNVKDNSGNVVKALKQQNLIQTNQNQIIFQ
jgi:hypothetical protein